MTMSSNKLTVLDTFSCSCCYYAIRRVRSRQRGACALSPFEHLTQSAGSIPMRLLLPFHIRMLLHLHFQRQPCAAQTHLLPADRQLPAAKCSIAAGLGLDWRQLSHRPKVLAQHA